MPSGLAALHTIEFCRETYGQLLDHARRKLAGEHGPDEEAAPKAYGLIGGTIQGAVGQVTIVRPLRRNLRSSSAYKPHIDRLMDTVAVPSVTPNRDRGWVAAPDEVLALQDTCDATGAHLLGGYHMHRIAWAHDPVRDRCTALDRQLAEGSGLWVFILSMVDPSQPRLRAFFEGDNDQEARVSVPAADAAVPRGRHVPVPPARAGARPRHPTTVRRPEHDERNDR